MVDGMAYAYEVMRDAVTRPLNAEVLRLSNQEAKMATMSQTSTRGQWNERLHGKQSGMVYYLVYELGPHGGPYDWWAVPTLLMIDN